MSFEKIISSGYRPFLATSQFLLSSLNTSPFGLDTTVFVQDKEHLNFHKAYLLANTLAFGTPKEGLGMPGWVYTDLVLSQTAVVGLIAPIEKCPEAYVKEFRDFDEIDMSELQYLPVAAQIAGRTANPNVWFGFSLISHQRKYGFEDELGISIAPFAKALALEAYQAKEFMGLTQYENSAVRHHGQFGRMFIHEPFVWTHSRPKESFIYRMNIEFDHGEFYNLDTPAIDDFDFMLNSRDDSKKDEIADGIKNGIRFEIVSPYQVVEKDGSRSCPIRVHTDEKTKI